jgi:uncharacterized protein YbbC (DUF1343 family)/CubicO group peptidase (beta-lactamase class C family)
MVDLRKYLSLLLGSTLALTSCRTPDRAEPLITPIAPKPGEPIRPDPAVPTAAETFDFEKLAQLDSEILEAIAEGKLPGGVLWIEHRGAVHKKAYGHRALVPALEKMTADTIFDAASLTKVIATGPAIAKLIEEGRIELDAPVITYLPGFRGSGKEAITIRHLLTHTSGLRPGLGRRAEWQGVAKAIEFAEGEELRAKPGESFVYSDINYILLGEIVHRVSGQDLNEFTRGNFYGPLGMSDTGFLPNAAKLPRIAPTTRERDGSVLRGVVHDPTSRRMGGIAGHAGLFFSAADLAKLARAFLNKGQGASARILSSETVALMTTNQAPATVSSKRGIGWDIDTGYSGPRGLHFSGQSYGHTGWTGTSIWIDPPAQTFVIFLSNRNHPTEDGTVVQLRKHIGTLAAEAIKGVDWSAGKSGKDARLSAKSLGATPEVINGIDVLKRRGFDSLRGLKVGLITNHTGRDRLRNPTIDLLHRAPEVELTALFSPEHGIRGTLDAKVEDGRDSKTGLPIYSLYGSRRIPTAEQLSGLDALVFDIQDIGARFYTYASTMGNCLEAAGKAGIRFVVLDRVNPINGTAIAGPIHEGEPSFVAYHSVPLRHGMTLGELARMYNVEKGWNAELEVVAVQNWNRRSWFDETGLPWTNPSPNMRSLTAAAFYPGLGLVEFSISVGRGTPKPFEIFGAPYVQEKQLVEELRKANLAGVEFEPVRFTPTSSVFKGKSCGGAVLILTDRSSLKPIDLGIVVASTLQRLYPDEFALDKVNRLLQHEPTLEAIRAGKALAEIKALWQPGLNQFLGRRKRFLLYP